MLARKDPQLWGEAGEGSACGWEAKGKASALLPCLKPQGEATAPAQRCAELSPSPFTPRTCCSCHLLTSPWGGRRRPPQTLNPTSTPSQSPALRLVFPATSSPSGCCVLRSSVALEPAPALRSRRRRCLLACCGRALAVGTHPPSLAEVQLLPVTASPAALD